MSVTDLAGIQQLAMRQFIDNMMDASHHPAFNRYRQLLQSWIENPYFISQLGIESQQTTLTTLVESIPAQMVSGVTLSTMHDCPPDEIEAICRYILQDKKLNTFVKLNPTLLVYQRVIAILDNCGFDYIGLKEASFQHDLKLEQALAMLRRLMTLASEKQIGF
ncbi:hypothetical protein ARAF_1997 [Arsenophonus endosymbiont of Aleurodicus floccissimus]|nr:hypothetical protein ARAF_1997 [Arsenophonus endosymbiont of Aleurodicus floccissimus]